MHSLENARRQLFQAVLFATQAEPETAVLGAQGYFWFTTRTGIPETVLLQVTGKPTDRKVLKNSLISKMQDDGSSRQNRAVEAKCITT